MLGGVEVEQRVGAVGCRGDIIWWYGEVDQVVGKRVPVGKEAASVGT